MKKYILITGASGGIGRAVALELASLGYNLYLHYNKNTEAINKLMEKLKSYNGEYIPIAADLSVHDGYKIVSSQIFSLDGIIHCGGTSHYGLFIDLKEEETSSLLHLHVFSPLMLTKELLPKLISKRSGSIVVVTSIWGQTGAACEVAYSTVKGAQISFVKSLSKELALSGIRVNGVAPGAINTSMMASFTKEDIGIIQDDIPMGRLGNPEEVAKGAAFLLSDDASYITGQILGINGGWYS
jgi:3-oxoacyl-[acyl-carrier protein] reductase